MTAPTSARPVHTILAIAAILGAACALAMAAAFGVVSGASCALGAIIGITNLWALAKLIQLLLDDAAPGRRRARAAILLGAKSLVLITLVGVLVVKGWVRGGALMAGISVVALAIVIGGLLRSDDDSASPRSLN